VGCARSFELAAYVEARNDALTLIGTSIGAEDHTTLFRTTETYRAGAEGKERTDELLRTLYSLLEDLLFVKSGTPELVRNSDIGAELKRLASAMDFPWIVAAAQRIGEVESGMRRNLLRSLSLDAMVAALERP
jgi:DNA polymerase-3 subunit delta'